MFTAVALIYRAGLKSVVLEYGSSVNDWAGFDATGVKVLTQRLLSGADWGSDSNQE